ncbi:hypothetical protein C8R46DRAFT_1201855 [Mycena filopes]|nr:hypothetical protein C8R46DRAFT_1201855 [Mycena filopes]
MQLDCLSLPPAPLPPPPTSTTSYHLPLTAPTTSLITIGGADDLDSEDPTRGCLRSPALLPPTSRSSSPASHSHQSQPGGHRTRTSQPPSRPTPTLPTLVEHSNRAAPLTRKLNHLAQLACESIRRTHTRFPDVPTTPGGFIELGDPPRKLNRLIFNDRFLTFDFNAYKLEIVIVGLSASKLKGRGFRRSQNRLVQYLGLGSRAQITGVTHTEPSNGGSILELEILSRLLLGFRPAVENEIPVVNPRPKIIFLLSTTEVSTGIDRTRPQHQNYVDLNKA